MEASTSDRAAEAQIALNNAVQALLGVLNDIGMCNPWKYNVITEAAEDALDAAMPSLRKSFTLQALELLSDAQRRGDVPLTIEDAAKILSVWGGA